MQRKRRRSDTTAETKSEIEDREEPVGLMRDVVAHTETSPPCPVLTVRQSEAGR